DERSCSPLTACDDPPAAERIAPPAHLASDELASHRAGNRVVPRGTGGAPLGRSPRDGRRGRRGVRLHGGTASARTGDLARREPRTVLPALAHRRERGPPFLPVPTRMARRPCAVASR